MVCPGGLRQATHLPRGMTDGSIKQTGPGAKPVSSSAAPSEKRADLSAAAGDAAQKLDHGRAEKSAGVERQQHGSENPAPPGRRSGPSRRSRGGCMSRVRSIARDAARPAARTPADRRRRAARRRASARSRPASPQRKSRGMHNGRRRPRDVGGGRQAEPAEIEQSRHGAGGHDAAGPAPQLDDGVETELPEAEQGDATARMKASWAKESRNFAGATSAAKAGMLAM